MPASHNFSRDATACTLRFPLPASRRARRPGRAGERRVAEPDGLTARKPVVLAVRATRPMAAPRLSGLWKRRSFAKSASTAISASVKKDFASSSGVSSPASAGAASLQAMMSLIAAARRIRHLRAAVFFASWDCHERSGIGFRAGRHVPPASEAELPVNVREGGI